MLNKTSFQELSKKNKRQYVLFGSGNIAKKTAAKVGANKVSFIVDNSTNLQGSEFEGLQVKSPNVLTKNHFILICSTAISDISVQLNELGLVDNIDFAISPILNDLLAISELENKETSFFFTSGTTPSEEYGGGLYQCIVNASKVELTKVYSGACYGAIRYKDSILFVDTDNGLLKYSNNKVNKLTDLPLKSRAHGISYNEESDCIYITCSYLDAVIELNSEYKITRQFNLSNKLAKSGSPQHHCNDNLAIGNSLFVSMFSSTGNWKQDVFDGCIAEFEIDSGKRLNDIKTGLYMPHNVKIYDNSIHILDSLPGNLLYSNLSIQGTFPAFTRGLDYKDGLYYIGQSKNRNYSRVMGLSNNVSIDCGTVLFDPIIKASRFIQFPHAIGEIHSIVIDD